MTQPIAEPAKPVHLERNGFLCRFFDEPVTLENKRRKNSENADQTDHYTFRHDQTKIRSNRKTHENKRQQTDKGRNGTAGNRREGIDKRTFHCQLPIRCFAQMRFFLPVPVQQNDRVVHGQHQLKNRRHGKRLLGNGSHDQIGSHVNENGNSDRNQEQDRFHPGFAHAEQNDDNADDRHHDDPQRKIRNAGICDIAADIQFIGVSILLQNSGINGFCFRRIGIVSGCNHIKRVIPFVIFPVSLLPGHALHMLQSAKPVPDGCFLLLRNTADHQPQRAHALLAEFLRHQIHSNLHR